MSFRSLIVCALLIPALWGEPGATLTGRVNDPTGAPIAGAKVEISNPETGLKRSSESNSQGVYVLTNLPFGTYHVQVQAQGFETVVQEGVLLHAQDIATQNYYLKVGSVSTTITVEGGASMLQMESGAVGTVVDRRFVENMPLNGRSFQSLITLAPGVVLTPSTGLSQGQFSVNGQRSNANYFTIDGVSASFASTLSTLGQNANGSLPAFNASGATNGLVSIDGLQEFRTQTSSYSAEYGRSPGAQIAILTRSGTNQLHGTLFDFFRNDILNANDWFANRNRLPRPAERQNDFGGVLGGPVVLPHYDGRDRTFFFLSYEGLNLRQPQSVETTVPSLATRARLSPIFQALANALPAPTGADDGSGFAQFAATYSNPTTMQAGSIRLDHLFSKHTLFFRYNQSPDCLQTRSTGGLSNIQSIDNRTKTVTLGTTATLRPTVTNDLRLNYSSSSFEGTNTLDNFGGAIPVPNSLLFPGFVDQRNAYVAVNLAAGSGYSAYSVGKIQSNAQRQFNAVETLSTVLGTHLVKLGLDYRRLFPVYSPVGYSLSLSSGSLDSLLAQNIDRATISTNDQVLPIFNNWSIFASDLWHVTSRLSITVGVRWELNPPPTEAAGKYPFNITNVADVANSPLARLGAPLYRTRYNNFAPRFGVAYYLRQQKGTDTVLRAGTGVFYDLGSGQASGAFLNYPATSSKFLTNVPFPLTLDQLARPLPVTTPPYPGSIITYDPDAKLPYSIHWNVALEQALGASQTLTVSYVAAAGRKLPAKYYYGLFGPINPNFRGSVGVVRNILTSDYASLQVQFERRFSKGLQALAAYTWAHSIDDVSDETLNDVRRGNSNFDLRHVFRAAISYDLPGLVRAGILSKATAHWSVDGIVFEQSAPPVDITPSGFQTPDGQFFYVWPNVVSGVPIYVSDSSVPGGRRINAAAFKIPAAGTSGTLGRNVLRGFPLSQLDLTLRRSFRLTEGLSLQARIDAFNLLNHPNFGSPYTANLRNPSFGQPRSMYGTGLGFGPGFGGFNPLYQVGGPRSYQLSLKFLF